MTVRTEKQQAIVEALQRRPAANDSTIAKETGASRNLVRRMRERLGLVPTPPPRGAAGEPAAASRAVPWPKVLDGVFLPDGVADELEGFVRELVELGGRLDRRLCELEIQPKTHHLRSDRHTLVRQIYQLARTIQAGIVPAGPCPFCEKGCARCAGGGWVPATMVDAVATIEERNSRRRWWRVHKVEVPL